MTYVSTDTSVITDQLSDHGWPLFITQNGPILSANFMCSGENHDPNNANSFQQHPTRWAARYTGLVTALRRNANEALERHSQFPIIAIQEFPRLNARFNTQASTLYSLMMNAFQESDGWSILFGEKDDDRHDFAQLCVVVPPGHPQCELQLPPKAHRFCDHGQYGPSRFQVVQVDQFVLINLHPGPAGSVPQILGEAAVQLLQRPEVQVVHVVGDWNRTAQRAVVDEEHTELLNWSPVESSPPGSHLSGASRQKFDENGLPTVFSNASIDLHVSISAGPEMVLRAGSPSALHRVESIEGTLGVVSDINKGLLSRISKLELLVLGEEFSGKISNRLDKLDGGGGGGI